MNNSNLASDKMVKYNSQGLLERERWDFLQNNAGQGFPSDHVRKAHNEIEEFCNILRGEGVTVQRPDIVDFTQPYQTPDFESSGN